MALLFAIENLICLTHFIFYLKKKEEEKRHMRWIGDMELLGYMDENTSFLKFKDNFVMFSIF